jgi:hypothetical protein
MLATHMCLQPLLSPSNILFHRKVPFQKMPPHGKILKKRPWYVWRLHGVPTNRFRFKTNTFVCVFAGRPHSNTMENGYTSCIKLFKNGFESGDFWKRCPLNWGRRTNTNLFKNADVMSTTMRGDRTSLLTLCVIFNNWYPGIARCTSLSSRILYVTSRLLISLFLDVDVYSRSSSKIFP